MWEKFIISESEITSNCSEIQADRVRHFTSEGWEAKAFEAITKEVLLKKGGHYKWVKYNGDDYP